MSVTTKIRKQGGAAVMTIPPALLKMTDLAVGVEVTLKIEDGKLVAEPAARSRRRYSMAELLKGSAAMKRLTAETAWARDGAAAGNEIA